MNGSVSQPVIAVVQILTSELARHLNFSGLELLAAYLRRRTKSDLPGQGIADRSVPGSVELPTNMPQDTHRQPIDAPTGRPSQREPTLRPAA